MDNVSEGRLALVHPDLARRVRTMALHLQVQGIVIRVVQGLRAVAEQDALYAKGRTVTGAKVTNARGGSSWHNYGLAVDCVPGVRGATLWTPNWDAQHADYKAMIAAGEAQGLVSGACWKTMPDMPHFQLAGVPVSPDVAHRELIAASGMQAVWAAVAV